MRQVVGIGEHSDVIETIPKELDKMVPSTDRIYMLDPTF